MIVFQDIISHIVQQYQPSPPPLRSSAEAKSVSLWELNFLETRRIILLNNMFIKKIGSRGFILHSTLFTRRHMRRFPTKNVTKVSENKDWSCYLDLDLDVM